jgi:hypothetical protein
VTDDRNGSNDDVAGPGHDFQDEEHKGEDDPQYELDARREDGQGDCGQEDQASGSGLSKAETPVREARQDGAKRALVAQRFWSGRLPSPGEFLKYPDSVQQDMVRWESEGVENERKLIEHSIEMDRRQSDRLDRLAAVDEEQIPRAQRYSLILNVLLIAGAAIAACFGQVGACIALIGGLTVINAMSMYVSTQPKGVQKTSEKTSQKNARGGEGSKDS